MTQTTTAQHAEEHAAGAMQGHEAATEGHGVAHEVHDAAHGAADAAHSAGAELAHAAHGAAGHAESGGLPQLDFATFPNQVFWLLIALAAIWFLLTRIALPRIGGILAERQGTITNDIAAAEELKMRAEEASEAYDKALADARTEAHRIAEETREKIKGELDKATAKADAEIAARAAESEKRIGEIRDSAMANVEVVAKDTAREIASAFGVDAKDIDKLVDQRLKG